MNLLATFATIVSAIATAVAAIAAWKSANSSREAVKLSRRNEETRLSLQKKEILIKNFQCIVSDFAQIRAYGFERWFAERGIKVKELDKNISRNISVILCLDPEIGKELSEWKQSDIDGQTYPYIVSNILGTLNANLHDRHAVFFEQKSRQLIKIQDKIFSL
ncbi:MULTISPECIES: hypothetical protein [unclassified Halomonas]|uniref:hypothetical protein n=1 Tax=unclassified Halomonas TaxID=2609666 RepID=UPI00209D33E0|nr:MULTISPECIES: hypothetical protein [unclassified Halomonas]MCP1313358.1 hypothetical protein [Halomonas sp. 707D7]MCP1326176.1 hypothetical protein [Halomonas sp. 707D4]